MARPWIFELESAQESPDEFRDRFLPSFGSALSSLGYAAGVQTSTGASFSRKYSPVIYILLYIVLFPVGLLFLLLRPVQTVTVEFEPENGGSLMRVSGRDDHLRRYLLRDLRAQDMTPTG